MLNRDISEITNKRLGCGCHGLFVNTARCGICFLTLKVVGQLSYVFLFVFFKIWSQVTSRKHGGTQSGAVALSAVNSRMKSV